MKIKKNKKGGDELKKVKETTNQKKSAVSKKDSDLQSKNLDDFLQDWSGNEDNDSEAAFEATTGAALTESKTAAPSLVVQRRTSFLDGTTQGLRLVAKAWRLLLDQLIERLVHANCVCNDSFRQFCPAHARLPSSSTGRAVNKTQARH